MKSVTIADVARTAGVSKATVSAVINQKSYVKESTRRQILQVMDELNYRPSSTIKRQDQGKDKAIAFVIKQGANTFYADVLAGIRDYAFQHGYFTFTSSSEGQPETERRIVEQFAKKEFNGMIINPIITDDSDVSHLFDLKRNNIPFVLLGEFRGIQSNLIDVDNTGGSFEAVKHLIQLGHTHIAHFSGPAYSENSEERITGFRRAFSESHLIWNEKYIVPTGDLWSDGYQKGLEFFRTEEGKKVTAVTCYNDMVALGLLKALDELDLRVPEDVSIIGFDDLNLLEFFPLPLTTVHTDKYEIGTMAAEILIRHIESTHALPLEKVFIKSKLLVRNSTCPPKNR